MNTALPRTLAAAALALALVPPAHSADLPAVEVARSSEAALTGFDGVIEAVRQAVVSAQVPGTVVQVGVKAGDKVTAGQILLRIDARAAEQGAAAGDAQVAAARASLEVATAELARQRALYEKRYISKAALEQAESAFKATQAQVNAQRAQASAAHTQSGFHVIRAPFAGVIAEVPVSVGDMAMPGRALLTVYDPAALRVTAAVPQSVAGGWTPPRLPRVEVPGLNGTGAELVPVRAERLPTVDPATHTMQIRADLPPGVNGLAPGMFARVWLPIDATPSTRDAAALKVPARAIVRRAELTALYVLDPAGKPVLRQVRVGRRLGDELEVLSGVSAGDRVVTDPQAAARAR